MSFVKAFILLEGPLLALKAIIYDYRVGHYKASTICPRPPRISGCASRRASAFASFRRIWARLSSRRFVRRKARALSLLPEKRAEIAEKQLKRDRISPNPLEYFFEVLFISIFIFAVIFYAEIRRGGAVIIISRILSFIKNLAID